MTKCGQQWQQQTIREMKMPLRWVPWGKIVEDIYAV